MNTDKESLIYSWKLRSYFYFIANGIKRISKFPLSIFISVIYCVLAIIVIVITILSSSKFSVVPDMITNCFSLICIFVALTLVMGMPKIARKCMRNFIRIGLHNHAYETPLLMDIYEEEHYDVLKFRNFGVPLSKWNDLKDSIESILNYNIINIEEQGKKWILIKAVSGDIVLPDCIEWEDTYLSPSDEFTLALGEGYYGKVKTDLRTIPHILIGGSTGSGKSVLLKLLLMQCVKKRADVVIIDFKGGVDFSTRFWTSNCEIITDIEPLKLKLNEMCIELHNRLALLKKSNCKNIDDYNARNSYNPIKRIVIGCDEVAQLLDRTGLDKQHKEIIAELEAEINTIARLGRAAGIHLILATQRPDANVISGQIKNNIDCRICGRADDVLSQIILDNTDANDIIPKTSQGRFLMNDGTVFQAYWFDDEKIYRGMS